MPPQSSSSSGPVSPISLLLHGLGMTRDDLTRHSDQMRQFLVTEKAGSLRALTQEPSDCESATSPILATAQSRPKSRSFSVTDASVAARQTPPPITPIKSEPVEPVLSARRYDSMEEVIERQNRNKRRARPVPEESPSPPPSSSRSVPRAPSHSHGRISGRTHHSAGRATPRPAAPQSLPRDSLPAPLTPKMGRHYRDTVLYQSVTKPPRGGTFIPRAESPSPSRTRRSSAASTSYRSISVDSSATGCDAQPPLPSPRLVDEVYPPITPRRNRYKASMASSSPATGSPFSSPARPIVNIVSSPGPMEPEPEEDEYDKLPFKLPPGPYSPVKPDLPYAALIGQAILASPQHRLTLQEIYHYITIVWPHFKRNEQTWMNSIRHVLSTTMVFRKVQRDRAAGRTLWAIFDQDLDCFANGGFRKELCADMEEQKANYVSRKRAAEKPLARKSKRSKKVMQEEASPDPPPPAMGIPLSSLPSISFAPPLFPPPRPGTHHQPYYATYSVPAPPPLTHPHTLPAGVIFPPLPPSSAYHRLNLVKPTSDEHVPEGSFVVEDPSPSRPPTSPLSLSGPDSYLVDLDATEGADLTPSPTLIPASSSASSASLPPLTPNNSSSSPPEPAEEAPPAKKKRPSFDLSAWLVSPEAAPLEALAPGITLLNHEDDTLPTVKFKGKSSRKGKDKAKDNLPSKMPEPPRAPESPTLMRQAARNVRLTTPPRSLPVPLKHFVTPPSRAVTPRKSSSGHQMSAMRTPLSHLGVHMSPSPSLAHYKSNLNPPPSFSPPADGENLHTPLRPRNSSMFTPLTPRKLLYPAGQDSPFRTPGRGIFDPHDPSALLDEELARLGAQSNSPQGLFASAPGLMYESPSTPSSRWARMW